MKLHLFFKDLLMGRLTTFVVCIPLDSKESEEFLFESSGFAILKKKKHTDVQNRILDSVGEARVGCFKRTASKHVYYLGWNRSPAQAGCMRQVPSPGALGRPRGIGWRGRWEGGSEWGIHVNPWLIHVNVWQKPLQYCKVISLQLIKINEKKKTKNNENHSPPINWSTMAVRDPWKAAQISLYQ